MLVVERADHWDARLGAAEDLGVNYLIGMNHILHALLSILNFFHGLFYCFLLLLYLRSCECSITFRAIEVA